MAEINATILPFVPTRAPAEPPGRVEDRARQPTSRFSAGRDDSSVVGAAPFRGPAPHLESPPSTLANIGFLVHMFAEEQSAIEGPPPAPAKDVHRRAFSAYLTAQEMAPAADRAGGGGGSSYNLEA